jgi:hypothetical protein
MKKLACLLFLSAIFNISQAQETKSQEFQIETIVFMRHAEKPESGLGQLSCQGLHRSLALPKMLIQKYGPPRVIFAPNPSKQKEDKGHMYDYIRPLATIEPTAITLGMPVSTQWGFEDISSLKNALTDIKYENDTIYVAWEHRLAEELVKIMVKEYGGLDIIPYWDGYDFDSLYVVKITTMGKKKTIEFIKDKEDLNNQKTDCQF